MFISGTPKPEGSGRKLGTMNRATRDAKRIAEELGCDPFEVLIRFAKGDAKGLGQKPYKGPDGKRVQPFIPLDMRLQAATAAAKYLYPQRKAVETEITEWRNPYLDMTPEERAERRAFIESVLADDGNYQGTAVD